MFCMAKTIFKYFIALCFLAVLLSNQAWGYSRDIKSIHFATETSTGTSLTNSNLSLHAVYGIDADNEHFADLFSGEKEGEFDEEVKIGNESSLHFLVWAPCFADQLFKTLSAGYSTFFRPNSHQFTSAKKFIFFQVFRI